MTQFHTLNGKPSYSQLKKIKPGIKNGTEVTLKLSSNVVGDSSTENNFPHKVLLFNKQVSRPCKAFANGLSTNTKLLKNSIASNKKLGRFLGRRLGPLLKTDFVLIKNVLKGLAKNILKPLNFDNNNY